MRVTASMLYDLIQCPHRLAMDRHGDPAKRDPVNPFVELLWERGTTWEEEVIAALALPYINLKGLPDDQRKRRTLEAMRRGEPLILGGRIEAADLLGDPDVLRREDEGYLAGDIKSGGAFDGVENGDDGKPKKHYGVQLALYTDILERLDLCHARRPFVWDVHGREVVYDLNAPLGKRTPQSLWGLYLDKLEEARGILGRSWETAPACSSTCKLCHWHTECLRKLEEMRDITLLPELGRSRRGALPPGIRTIKALAGTDLSSLGKVGRIGEKTLRKFVERARLRMEPDPKPYLKEPIVLPKEETELFFDIETDPMRDICYLHGFTVRRAGDSASEQYVPFLAERPDEASERRAFEEALAFIRRNRPCALYYYAPYERTWWRKLRERYPDTATEEEIETLFAAPATVDLYTDIVRSRSEWPTRDFSIKTLAKYCGFAWRDKTPSGAASIEWYHKWIDTGEPQIRQRILDYNEDDCVAMRVLVDRLDAMASSCY